MPAQGGVPAVACNATPTPGTAMTPSDPPSDRPADQKLAVALRYDGKEDPAPRIAATGRGLVAERILALAKENGVPVHEDPDLASLLGKLELDAFIPVEAFVAVAEILAYLYRQNGKLKEQNAHR